MTQRRIFLVQTLLEALIPVIGYFEWGWDLSFILLFYLIDWLLAYSILIAKGNKRLKYSRDVAEKQLFLKNTAIGGLLLVAACAGIGTGIVFLHPQLDWLERIHAFLTYEDWGIQQGYVLIPLIVLNGILVYRQQFLMPARFRVQTMHIIMRPFIIQALVLLGCAGILMGVTSLLSFPEEILIVLLIAGTSLYRWLVIRGNA